MLFTSYRLQFTRAYVRATSTSVAAMVSRYISKEGTP